MGISATQSVLACDPTQSVGSRGTQSLRALVRDYARSELSNRLPNEFFV